jgi:hypothetical protein
MTMRNLIIAVAVVIFIIIAAIVMAPASLMDRIVSSATAHQWRIENAQGTPWNGSGTVAILTKGHTETVTPLAWKFKFGSLFSGHMSWRFGESPDKLNSAVTIGSSLIELDNVNLQIPASALVAVLPTKTIHAMSGTITLTTTKLTFDGKARTGTLNVLWQDAAMMVNNEPLRLGKVTAVVAPDQATVTNSDGDLMVNGNAKLTPAGTITGGAFTLTPTPNTPESAKQLINAFGTKKSDGSVTVRL